jgi:hypothetical protein
MLFDPTGNFSKALADARMAFTSPQAKILLDFVAQAKRGVCMAKGAPHNDDENAAPAGAAPL